MLDTVTGPELSSSRSRRVAAKPSSLSRAQCGGCVSGASMSAMRILTPSIQNVSPSTTQFLPPPV